MLKRYERGAGLAQPLDIEATAWIIWSGHSGVVLALAVRLTNWVDRR